MDGWQRARDAAWRRFGHEHYRGFITLAFLARLLPPLGVVVALGLVAAGLWWLWGHIHWHPHWPSAPHWNWSLPHINWWLIAFAAGIALVAVGIVAWQRLFAMPHATGRRWPVAVILLAVAGLLAWIGWG